MGSFVVYMLRTSGNTLYTGQTNDLSRRLCQHREKKRGAKYMKRYGGFELVYSEEFDTRSEAMKREAVIKKMTKLGKELLVSGK